MVLVGVGGVVVVVIVVSLRRHGVPMTNLSIRRWVRCSFVVISLVSVQDVLP